jgi:hypothetical protein
MDRMEAYAVVEALLVHARLLRLEARRRNNSGGTLSWWRKIKRNNARFNEELAARIAREHNLPSL